MKELRAELVRIWCAMPKSYFESLAESMPGRLREVIARKGGITKY